MDVRCVVCAEPWDMDELHDVPGMTFDEAYRVFRSEGCGAVFGCSCEPHPAGDAIGMLADLLGDDVDGFASMSDDIEALLL